MPHTGGVRPSILVLMAARNGELWIAEQLQSIAAQRGVDVDVVISDDGSTDGTGRVAAGFSTTLSISILSPPAPTGSAAQNFFWLMGRMSAGTHDFVALADQDDLWLEDKLESACRALKDSDAVGCSSAVTAFWPDGSENVLGQVSTLTRADFLFEGAGQGCTFVMTAAFFDETREFLASHADLLRSIHYHDWTLYALARAWKKRWFFDSTPRMRYRQHASNDTGARRSMGGVKKRLGLIRRGWYGKQLRAMAEVCAAAAPDDPVILDWRLRLGRRVGPSRRAALVGFLLKGGRRRRSDTLILIVAATLGWI